MGSQNAGVKTVSASYRKSVLQSGRKSPHQVIPSHTGKCGRLRLKNGRLRAITGTIRKIGLKIAKEELIPTMFQLMRANPAVKHKLLSFAPLQIQPESMSTTGGN